MTPPIVLGVRRRSRRSRRLASLCVAAGSLAGFVRPLHAEEYRSHSLDAIASLGYGASAVGRSLLGDLGAQFFGIQSFRDRALLVAWDTLFAVRGGVLGNEHPFTPLVGPRTLLSVASGYRWLPERHWSFYTGAGVSGDVALLTRPGTDIVQLRTVNRVDGVGGRTADSTVRADAGVSLLDGARSLLLVAFFQEALTAPGFYTRGTAFREGGIAARFDLAYSLMASVEVRAGQTGTIPDAALGLTDKTTMAGFFGVVRKKFGRWTWLAVTGGYSREFVRVAFAGNIYRTATPPTSEARLFYAVPLGASGDATP
jgi:hypothetical protein